MKIDTNFSEKELRNIHFETLEWKSSIQFIQGEILFMNQLLQSYVFEPTTPNLFERLQGFKLGIENLEKEVKKLQEEIQKHENELGGILECDTISCDTYYAENHNRITALFKSFYKEFQTLKYEVFKYAGGILKTKKK